MKYSINQWIEATIGHSKEEEAGIQVLAYELLKLFNYHHLLIVGVVNYVTQD